jgi:predicted dinucleotide-binding enzyme
MEIAIIGAGNVGSALGKGWAAEGHSIVYGVRDPGAPKLREVLSASHGKARAASVAEAASSARIVVLAVPWPAARDALSAAGDLGGKILVDATNPLRPGLDGLAVGPDTSAAEQIARWAAGASVVKAFNTTGSGNMEDPVFHGEAITMFICGDSEDAKRTVGQLAGDLGFDVVDAGALVAARHLESLALFWVHLAYNMGMGRDFAFKLVRR